MQRIAIVSVGILVGCGHAAPPPATAPAAAAPAGIVRIEVPTDNGLSDLSLDDSGGAWVVAERNASAYRIALDAAATRVVSIDRVPIDGVPPDTDLEAITWLGPDRFAIGVEGHAHGAARVYVATLAGGRITLGQAIELPEALVGLPIGDNDGVEGVCGRGDTIFASIESNAKDDQGRWAPIVRIDLAGGAPTVTRLSLTSDTGKISALSCTIDPDGTGHLQAIERHFKVTHIITAEVPAHAAPDQRLATTVVRDLADELHFELNLEGLATLPDGRWLTVVDNQYETITGPNLLVVIGAKAP
ncbi:MAG: esterase-like activity of phytase family protein [Deltaproteobacteria bacterium]|nr:esterase-like activity of phytase family protein [Deltaproteobacteria bacterium]